MSEAPGAVYEERRGAQRLRAERLAARAASLSNARLAVFVLGVAGAVAVWGAAVLPALALAPVVLLFLVLVVWHDRVIEARDRADRAVAFYERGLARLDGSWPGGGVSGDAFLDPKHPYAADLDVFGRGSLFELLCTARTAAGEARLASWLCTPASPDEVRERQAAVAELRPRLVLREELALLGDDVRAGVHPELLDRWAAEEPLPSLGIWRAAAALLAAFSSLALVGWVCSLLGLPGTGAAPFFVALSGGALLALRFRGRASHILSAADEPARDLALLAHLLERLDRERFESPRLLALSAVFATDSAPAWREIERLRRLLGWADARRNQFFAPLGALWLWGTQFSLAIEAWRQRRGRELAGWLEAVGEIEALV
ncbi:MAG: DNA mismatch repair protein MutS, partial [Myxococcota bacterium]|nr:DNA mismatch repair protein MutS [Myxococcota bacterium]